jgi:hypothetical protein
MFPISLISQESKEYYVVVKENLSIEPTQRAILANGSLSLTFDNQELNTFFGDKTVYKYEKAFSGTNSELLSRTYLLSIDENEFNISELIDHERIDFVEIIPKAQMLEYPNDFDVEIPSFAINPLDLVRAPLAWEIIQI